MNNKQDITLLNANDEKHGEWIVYWNNGQLHYKGEYINGKHHGDWVWYHINGQLYSKGEYINGEQHGDCVMYFSDGQLRFKGSYNNGKRVGMWKEWNYDTKEYDNIFYG